MHFLMTYPISSLRSLEEDPHQLPNQLISALDHTKSGLTAEFRKVHHGA